MDDSFDDMYGSVSDAKKSNHTMEPPTLSRWDIEDMLEEEKEKKEEAKKQAPKLPATVVLPTANILPPAASIPPFASMPSAANNMADTNATMPSNNAMPPTVSKTGSNTSVASTFTSGSSFSTPQRNGGKFTMRKFGSPGPSTYKVKTPTRRTPSLEINFWPIGYSIACVCYLLNDRGKESYAWKQFVTERVIQGASAGDNEDWQGFTFTPALTNVTLVEKRQEAHGSNEPLLGYNDYPERFLFFTLKCNPTFEDTRAKVTDFGNKLLEFFRYVSFPPYYIGEIDSIFTSKKLRDSLMNTKHELWEIIEKAKLRIVEEESLDSFFLDEKIKELVPEELMAKPSSEWPAAVVRKLYRSGQLPEDF